MDDLPRRRPGRPRAKVRSVAISTWLPIDKHDQVVRMAAYDGESVSAMVRKLLMRASRQGLPEK